jgi:hypothetical protein
LNPDLEVAHRSYLTRSQPYRLFISPPPAIRAPWKEGEYQPATRCHSEMLKP